MVVTVLRRCATTSAVRRSMSRHSSSWTKSAEAVRAVQAVPLQGLREQKDTGEADR